MIFSIIIDSGNLFRLYQCILSSIHRALSNGNAAAESDQDPYVSLLDVPSLLGLMRPDPDQIRSEFGYYPWINQPIYTAEMNDVCTREELNKLDSVHTFSRFLRWYITGVTLH